MAVPGQGARPGAPRLREGGCGKKNSLAAILDDLSRAVDTVNEELKVRLHRMAQRLVDWVRKVLRWLRNPGPKCGRAQLNLDETEMKATLGHILEYPWMGGKKGAANLVHDGAAWVGAASYDAIKRTIASLIGEEVQQRRTTHRPATPFEMPVANGLGQVWASDLFDLEVWGCKFHICDFMDVFNSEYLAVRATPHAAKSEFVVVCFEEACERRGGSPPTVCTKTDRGSQYTSAVFRQALEGKTEHVRIPPGTPWFNGEIERGHRDLRAVIHGELAKMKRPRPGEELAAVQEACDRAREILDRKISRPSLGNVTPDEIARGVEEEVKKGNREFVERQREARKHRDTSDQRPLRDRLRDLLKLGQQDMKYLLRFLRLMSRDYKFLTG